MVNFTDLPPEIWALIAWFIPKSQFSRLKLLNSFFLNCWMDRSWEVLLIRRDDHNYEKALQRLGDPFVATRTRILTIECNRSSFSPLTITFPALFRTITTAPFARTLRELSLRGNLGHFASLTVGGYLDRTSPFETLTKFSLILDSLHMRTTESSLSLKPFFRFLPPTLQHLNILNLSFTIDLSSLFDYLSKSACYPKLTFLELDFIFNPSFRYSCQSIHRFLLTHNNNLQLLNLNFGARDEENLGAWLTNLANAEFQFSSLQTLGISFSTHKTGLSAVLPLIKRTGPRLSSLRICFYPLTFEEAEQVVDALTGVGVQFSTTTQIAEEEPRKLKSLNMQIAQLSVPFLDLLARKLPQLEGLCLSAKGIVGSDQHSFYDLLYHRRYDPSSSSPTQDPLHTWKLRNFSAFVAQELTTDVLRAVAGAVPSVDIQDEVDGLPDED